MLGSRKINSPTELLNRKYEKEFRCKINRRNTWITWFASSGDFFCPRRARASISCSSWFKLAHSTWWHIVLLSKKLHQWTETSIQNNLECLFYLKQCHLLLKLRCLCCPLICCSLNREAFTTISKLWSNSQIYIALGKKNRNTRKCNIFLDRTMNCRPNS